MKNTKSTKKQWGKRINQSIRCSFGTFKRKKEEEGRRRKKSKMEIKEPSKKGLGCPKSEIIESI